MKSPRSRLSAPRLWLKSRRELVCRGEIVLQSHFSLDISARYFEVAPRVFNWVSKVIRVLLWFCFTSLCDWLKPFAPLSRPIRSKTQTNQSRLARARTRFPALDAGYMYLLRVLIGSLGNLCLLWLAGVITLVLVLRHSFEKRSRYSCMIMLHYQGWIQRGGLGG